MKLLRNICIAFAFAASSVNAALTLSTTPVTPTAVDTIVLELATDQPCAFVVPGTVEMAAPPVITVRYEPATNILCIAPVAQPQRIAIGRLPAGTYTINVVRSGSPASDVLASTTVRVDYPGFSTDPDPLDDYSGHYVSDNGPHEGVFVTQFGRTAFISYLYYDADGTPAWAVMSDARWETGNNGAIAFVGAVTRVERPSVSSTGTVFSFQILGMGRFTPGGQGTFDKARLDITGPLNVSRDLTRFRF